jgi:hypothetical protein
MSWWITPAAAGGGLGDLTAVQAALRTAKMLGAG